MEETSVETLPPPPGVINSIKAGFDAIASHITAIFLPLLLNLFLWLGPRLRMVEMFESIKGDLVSIWQVGGIPSEDIGRMLDWYEKAIPNLNLFWLFRTFPIGISSLLLPKGTLATPLGGPIDWQVNGLNLPLWFIFSVLFGWIGGALYFRNVASAALTNKVTPIRWSRALAQTAMLSTIFNMLIIAVSMPLMFVILISIQINVVLGNLVVLVLALASVWVIVPLFFWAHGVFLRQQNVLTSILSSVQLTRFTLPTSSIFIMTVFLLSYGLNFLWSIPSEDSWMTLVGIFGHSFVTTALLAASFIYYHEMSDWLQRVLERIRSKKVVKQA
ncbi:MAG TPA: hypothetical protein PK078_12995 [Anaerolineales bacterium]|nr:hypothetical protein [Anaerolineales bacterium]HNA90333.1 hypothetical protein [Anaerolineales bacterium]HNB36854.1 hypothetical protein [Anaerolineales bacterium]HNC07550.1 hypothetical protein [Anaerolineales bacterium]